MNFIEPGADLLIRAYDHLARRRPLVRVLIVIGALAVVLGFFFALDLLAGLLLAG